MAELLNTFLTGKNMTDEIELNARFELLISQRNNALNQNVLDAGVIAFLKSKIKSLELLISSQDEDVLESNDGTTT